MIDVRKEVIKTLKSYYLTIGVRGENTEQGFKKPCFFVRQLVAPQTHILNKRYKKKYSFVIRYFSDSKYLNEDCVKVAEELSEYMLYLNNNLAKGINIDYKIEDGVLLFFVDYILYVRAKEKEEYFKDIEVGADLKDDKI